MLNLFALTRFLFFGSVLFASKQYINLNACKSLQSECFFLLLFVYELGASTGQRDRQTDGWTNKRHNTAYQNYHIMSDISLPANGKVTSRYWAGELPASVAASILRQ